MKVLKSLAFVAATAGSVIAAGTAMPANAAVILCQGANCVQTDSNVLVNAGTTPLTGTYNNTDIDVLFESTSDTLVASGNGQASVGAVDNLLNQLKFTIESGFGFTSAIFNLVPVPGNAAGEAVSVFINYVDANGMAGSIQTPVNTNGQNFFGISGTNGEVFTSAGFTSNPIGNGIGEFSQLRLGGVAAIGAVPEPAAWVMMLLGMAGVGYSMRRKDKGGLRVRFA